MKRALFFLSVLINLPGIVFPQVLADSQVDTINGTCSGCAILNPQYAADPSLSTCSTLSLGVCGSGTCIDQTLQFSSGSTGGEYVGVVISDNNLSALDQNLLASLQITTYSNGVSNGDTQTSSQYTIKQGASGTYSVEFFAAVPFDAVQAKLALDTGNAVKVINVYYGYYTQSVLPIQISSFDAQPAEGYINVQFKSEQLQPNEYFILERSADAVNFTPVYVTSSSSISKPAQTYVYKDTDPIEGLSYYRLVANNGWGQPQILKTIAVNYESRKAVFSVYPNPANSIVNLKYELASDDVGLLNIYDVKGYRVATFLLNVLENKLEINENFEPGYYYYELLVNGKTQNKQKLAIIKN